MFQMPAQSLNLKEIVSNYYCSARISSKLILMVRQGCYNADLRLGMTQIAVDI